MEWISVNDKEPPTGEYYLALHDKDVVEIWHFKVEDGSTYWNFQHTEHHWLRSNDPVTHWMPLPEPPKAE